MASLTYGKSFKFGGDCQFTTIAKSRLNEIFLVLYFSRCIPKYWKTKSLSNLSDLKKEEANSLNLRVYQALSAQFQDILSFSSCKETGLNAIELGMVWIENY